MTATVTIDSAGRLVLPKAMRDKLHLRAGSKLTADIVADKIELKPEPDDEVRMVRKGKRWVLTGFKGPVDAGAAVKAAREERDAQIVKHLRSK